MKQIIVILSLVAAMTHGGKSFAATPDLPSCNEWRLACSSNYTNSNRPSSYPINYVVIHKVQGSAASAASWFQNCSANVSAHYTFNNSSGYCYQSVYEADIAWHAGNWTYNTRSVGIEHGGYVTSNDTATACYDASALETRSCIIYYGTPYSRSNIVGHSEVPGATHTDPGIYWNWSYYMSKCNPNPPQPPPPASPKNLRTHFLTPDGRLIAFGIFTDGSVRVNAQVAAGSSWGGFQLLSPGTGFTQIDPMMNADGTFACFGVGDGTPVWINWQNSPGSAWVGWQSLGGNYKFVQAFRYSDGRLTVIACDKASGAIHTNTQSSPGGSWLGWSAIGGVGFSQLSPILLSDGRMICFGVGDSSAVWINWQNTAGGSWVGWQSLGGPSFSYVKALLLPDNRLSVMAVGNGTEVWSKTQYADSSWGTWQVIASGSGFTRIDPVMYPDGRLVCFGTGHPSGVSISWQNSPGSAWVPWQSLGGSGFTTVDAIMAPDSHLIAFANGYNSPDWLSWQNGYQGAWSGWHNLGGNLK